MCAKRTVKTVKATAVENNNKTKQQMKTTVAITVKQTQLLLAVVY